MADEDTFPAFERDFAAIEEAVMETARGRWFLGEFARRNRVADTGVLLEAIGRIGEVIGDRTAEAADPRLRDDVEAVAGAIDRAQAEIAETAATRGASPSTRLSEMIARIVGTSETATADILEATERVQEAAWNLREAGTDPAVCDELDRRASQIHTACAYEGLTARRTRAILAALRVIEDRVEVMRRRILGGTAEVAARYAGQDDLAFVPVAGPAPDLGPKPAASSPEPVAPNIRPAPEAASPVRAAIPPALAAIEAIDFRERMKLFT